MNLQRLEKRIMQSEGRVLNGQGMHKPYLDHLGVPTIGYGCTSLMGQPVTMQDDPITEPFARFLMCHSIYHAIKDASVFLNDFWSIGAARQEALVEMAYQLGGPKQRKFIKAQAAGNARLWTQMAEEILDSRWHEQTPRRCQDLARMIKTNQHPWSIQ
jgi:GH24 family phage-related lysozyme (muramidase)